MPKITLKPLDDGQKSVEIPIGKTTIGRGPFLGCGDKKVSRNHAVLEVTEQGEVFLTPTHVNPCFFQPTADSPGTILKKDKPHKLEHGDSFSLLPRAFRYEVVVLEDVSSTVKDSETQKADAKLEEKVNGTSEEKEETSIETQKDSDKKETDTEIPNTNCQQNSKDAKSPDTERFSSIKNEEKKEQTKEEKAVENINEKSASISKVDEKLEAKLNAVSDKDPKKKEQTSTEVKEELSSKEDDLKNENSEPETKEGNEDEKANEKADAEVSDTRSERTLPNWMDEVSSPSQKGQKKVVLKTTKQHRREKAPAKRKTETDSKPGRKRKEMERLSESEESTPVANQRTSVGRSSRTNRQTRQGLSLDDFVASDDDEEWPSDESEPRLKRRKRSRRKADDSGSDWEMEHKKTKRVSYKMSSGSESGGNDWRSSPKKKKNPRGRRRKSKRSKEEEVPSDDDDDAVGEEEKSQTPPKSSKRKHCGFGKKCFRKNPNHLDQYCHPGDSDFEESGHEGEDKNNEDASGSEEGAEEEEEKVDTRKECPFGVNCYRKNPQHKKEFKHTKKVRPQREAAKQADKKSKDSDGNEEVDAYDLNDSLLNEDSDEYKPANSGSDYESTPHGVKRLPKGTKPRVTKNKRAKRV